MKRITSIFIVIVTVLLALCSCGKADNNTISALTVYGEYDIDGINFKDINDLESSIKELYPENEYLVFNNQDFINIVPKNKINGEIHTAQICLFQSKGEAYDEFVWQLFHATPQNYQCCVVRLNNVVVGGFTDIANSFLKHCAIRIPKERKVSPVAEKTEKNISVDITKLEESLSSYNNITYLYEGDDSEKELSAYKMVVNKDRGSILAWFDKTYAIELGDDFIVHFEMDNNQFAGKYVEYNNCAFIFLDDFWLDMIKQCEK